jgi:hypothetical protein
MLNLSNNNRSYNNNNNNNNDLTTTKTTTTTNQQKTYTVGKVKAMIKHNLFPGFREKYIRPFVKYSKEQYVFHCHIFISVTVQKVGTAWNTVLITLGFKRGCYVQVICHYIA